MSNIPQTMKAAVLKGPNQLVVQEVPTPRPGPMEVLLKVEVCACCSTDVALMAKPLPGQPPYGSFIPAADMQAYLNRVYSDDGLCGMIADPAVRGCSALEDSLLVGHARSRVVPQEQRCYLSSLYVLPGHQGKGVGIALMRRGARHAAEHGFAGLGSRVQLGG